MDRLRKHIWPCFLLLGILFTGSVEMQGCEIWELECDNGECVKGNARCNGKRHCSDGSDEKDCPAAPTTPFYPQNPCPEGTFECDDGRCIYYKWYCDGEDDCGDNSDETCATNDGGMQTGSIIGLGVAMACLAVVVAVITAMFLCIHSKRLKQAARQSRDIHQIAGPHDHLPAYVIGNNALLREPPPRYSSRPDLSAVNLGYTGDEVTRPPPYYTSNPNLAVHSMCSLEPPPSYSSRADLACIQDGGMHGGCSSNSLDHSVAENRSGSSSSATHNRTLSVSSRATLTDSLEFSRITLSNISGEHSSIDASKPSLIPKDGVRSDDIVEYELRYASTPAVPDLVKDAGFTNRLSRIDRRQIIRNQTAALRNQRSVSTPQLVFDIVDPANRDGEDNTPAIEGATATPSLTRSRKKSNLAETGSTSAMAIDVGDDQQGLSRKVQSPCVGYKRNSRALINSRQKARSSTALCHINDAFEMDTASSDGNVSDALEGTSSHSKRSHRPSSSVSTGFIPEEGESSAEDPVGNHRTLSDAMDTHISYSKPPAFGGKKYLSKSLTHLSSLNESVPSNQEGTFC